MILLSSLYVFAFYTITEVVSDEFNLSGDAGQAYALKINIGHPPQTLNVLVDTGSTTLAIASYPRKDSNIYFHSEKSTSIYHKGKEVQAKYSQGTWVGNLVSDFVQFSSLPSVAEVRTDIALITKSHKFFMNGSGWQGLLGLAYLPVGAWGENVIVGSWLDSVEKHLDKPVSFELKLCGTLSQTNSTHYGIFRMLHTSNDEQILFRTPILQKRWYEVGVLSVRLLNSSDMNHNATKTTNYIDKETCTKLNEEKSIIDSGTTNIRLPDLLFRQVVDQLRHAAQASNNLILDEFWYHGEAGCWPEPQEWSLPSLAIDLLSTEADNSYFTLEIPAQNFMRVVTAHNNSRESGSMSEFCYKLGLEAGGKETVLGYTAMEGLQMESKDNNSDTNLPYQENPLLTALIVEKSSSGKIQVLSNDRVILKRTESGRLLPFKLPDGAARKDELLENAYGLPGSSDGDVRSESYMPPSMIEHEMVHEPSQSIDEENPILESAPPRPSVLFNRSGGWIGWRPSDCGAKTRITGPFNTSTSLINLCQLTKPVPDVAESIKAAQWILCAISIIAVAVVIYLLAPGIKVLLIRPLPRTQQISLSQAALVQQDAT